MQLVPHPASVALIGIVPALAQRRIPNIEEAGPQKAPNGIGRKPLVDKGPGCLDGETVGGSAS